MSTKELIEAEIGAMDEKQLNELYPIVKQFAEAKKAAPQSFMSKLRSIKIDAPEDFATNFAVEPASPLVNGGNLRAEARQKGFGFLQGKTSSDAFLADRHAQAQAEADKVDSFKTSDQS